MIARYRRLVYDRTFHALFRFEQSCKARLVNVDMAPNAYGAGVSRVQNENEI